MSKKLRWLVAGCLLSCATASVAQQTPAVPAPLPAMRFASDPVGEMLLPLVRSAPRFQKIGTDLIGSPIELRIYRTFEMTPGGRAGDNVSGLLAASTLGLIPHMYSGEHVIHYDLLVNGAMISRFAYRKVLSRTHNIWSSDTTHGMGKDGLEWAKSTVDLFLKDSSADPKMAELSADFDFYFGAPKTP